jgi:intraflagellar transport protein 140
LTFFYTTETGIKYQDKYLLRSGIIDIFALKIPCFYSTERSKDEYFINKTTLHDYHKINTDDEIIKNSILNFSFYLTSGNLDEAYKSVKSIQSSAIWEKMAIMCVKSKRLDVAEICIGNMKFARGARSIREAKK